MEDGLQDLLWPFRVPGHTFWINHYTSYVSGLYQQDPGREAQRFCNSVPQ